eukprot:1706129-Rhodomonas_salina.6
MLCCYTTSGTELGYAATSPRAPGALEGREEGGREGGRGAGRGEGGGESEGTRPTCETGAL